MLPSATVENYLKAIYLGVMGLRPGQRLLPMGHLANALGVAPGTATTMVKALAESGLAEYEPYSGVTLTPSGEKLAGLVLRRHRLLELFLVKMMGFSWDEVHDEAEQLEHVVSDRLIERIDEMLGHPQTDPHGDPIPDPHGTLKRQEFDTLMTCPLNTPVTVTRVVDQDKLFLRFIESNHLKPGESIEVEERDAASDSVRVKGHDDRRITIGTRAASKLLVHVGRVVLLLAVLAGRASAQAVVSQDTPNRSRPFEILDNSFLVEEAFNQEAGIFQNVLNVVRSDGGNWDLAFTQEWPVFGQRHQASYTLLYASTGGGYGFGDVMLHYRLQALSERAGVPAFSPRISLIAPTGSVSKGLGNGSLGWQVNLPFSKQIRDVYLHWNAGFTHTPNAETGGSTHNLATPHVAASAIVRLRPMLNLMFESIAAWEALVEDGRGSHMPVVTLSPGLRGGWNIGDTQTILGLSLPLTMSDGDVSVGAFGYLSYELPFLAQEP